MLLPFEGSRAYGAMRVDLPPEHAQPEEFADAALHALLQVTAIDAAAVVVYTDSSVQHVPDGVLLPHLPVIEALLDAIAATGLRIVDALCVTPEGWSCYLSDEPTLAPAASIPSAPAVPGLGDVSGDQLAGAELPAGDLARREQVGRALRELSVVLEGHLGGHPSPGVPESPLALATAEGVLEDLPAFAESLLASPGDIAAYNCAALLWCLSRPVLRDAILVQWATDEAFGCRALDSQLGFSAHGAEIPDAVGEVFLGRGRRPDPDRLGCALHVAKMAASLAPTDAKVGALTAAAWLSWALGRSSHAGAYVDQALEIDPGHSMATLIGTMLSAGMLPEWTLRRGRRAC